MKKASSTIARNRIVPIIKKGLGIAQVLPRSLSNYIFNYAFLFLFHMNKFAIIPVLYENLRF